MNILIVWAVNFLIKDNNYNYINYLACGAGESGAITLGHGTRRSSGAEWPFFWSFERQRRWNFFLSVEGYYLNTEQ